MTKLTKNISQKNIKIKNIKDTLAYLRVIPNLKKMNLVELKMLRVEPRVSKLDCLKNLKEFIEREISQQLKNVIENLKNLVMNFDAVEY